MRSCLNDTRGWARRCLQMQLQIFIKPIDRERLIPAIVLMRASPQQSSLNLSPQYVLQYEHGNPINVSLRLNYTSQKRIMKANGVASRNNIWVRLFVKLIPQMFMKHASFDRQPSRNISISRCRQSCDHLISKTKPICEFTKSNISHCRAPADY